MATISRGEIRKSAERAAACELEAKLGAIDELPVEARISKAQREARRRSTLAALPDAETARRRFERILQGNELTDVNYLERGFVSGHAVARILLRSRGRINGFGTGFLVAPGVLMTNEHVLAHVEEVREASAQFRYEFGLDGDELPPTEFRFRTDVAPIFHPENDMALVAVEPASDAGESLDAFGWLRLDPTPGKGILGEYLTVVQHPGGERKQVCVRENRLIHYDPAGRYVWYQTDTVGGSSGSPVFNNAWDVVGLHHSGVARTEMDDDGNLHYLNVDGDRWHPEEGDDAIDWFANEGIRISRIMATLAENYADHPLARAVLTAPERPALHAHGGAALQRGDGFLLPLQVPITVRVGAGDDARLHVGRASGVDALPGAEKPRPFDPASERGVSVDQSNYDERNGFDPSFLGEDNDLRVQFPRLENDDLGAAIGIDGSQRLHYWNYTVMMNAERRLAYWCAANVDAGLRKGRRPSDNWFRDTRIPADPVTGDDGQTGEEFYGTQRDFEVERPNNPFDRGHLTSREDLQWGEDLALAQRNGDESYHFTNCAPQHLAFNQNRRVNGLWRGVEQHVIDHAGGGRLCIINGPVFDAPLSSETTSGLLALDPEGPRSPDPTFNGFAIPKQYFKVVAWLADGDLSAAGFVVTQENVLRGARRIVWPEVGIDPDESLDEGEILLYQLPIATIGRLTNLGFGRRLSRHDERPELEESTGVPGLISSLADVRFFD